MQSAGGAIRAVAESIGCRTVRALQHRLWGSCPGHPVNKTATSADFLTYPPMVLKHYSNTPTADLKKTNRRLSRGEGENSWH